MAISRRCVFRPCDSLLELTCSSQANILVTADERACLADFGLASVLHGSASVTGTSSLSGTLRWMSPELIKSSDSDGGTSTFASDVYALAMVFYEVRPPMSSCSMLELTVAMGAGVHRPNTVPRVAK